MICKKCGNEIDEKLPFCPYCGSSTAEEAPEAPKENEQVKGEQTPPVQPQAPAQPQGVYYANGQPVQVQPGQPVYISTDRFGGFPMKWYKFMTYFGVWAIAVTNFISAVTNLMGNFYESTHELYETYPFRQAGDVIYGVALLAVAAFAIFTGFSLLNLKKNAPTLLHGLFIASTALSTVYSVVQLIVTKGAEFSAAFNFGVLSNGVGMVAGITSLIISCGVSALIIVLNVIYYNKRKQFFVN